MSIKNPFTHTPGSDFDSECLEQIQENAFVRTINTMDRVAELDPKYHGNRPEVICQIAAAVVKAEQLLLLNQSIQEGIMFLGQSNIYIAKTMQKVATSKIKEEDNGRA